MSTEATMTGGMTASAEAKKTFAVCFAALVATSFCFILRAFSIGAWGKEFDLSQTQMGELAGVGLWPFAISIVLLSLIIDKIGFKMTLWFAAACHLLGLILILQANGYWSLYWGTFVLSLGNGAVEAGINPLIAREFRHDKTTWLNRLHAGWPAGFVLGGLLAMMFPSDMGWRYQMGAHPHPGHHVHRDAAAAAVPAQRARGRRRHVSRDARRGRRHQRVGRRVHDDVRARARVRLVRRREVGTHRRA